MVQMVLQVERWHLVEQQRWTVKPHGLGFKRGVVGKMSSVEVQTEAFDNYSDYQRMLHRIPLSDGWIPNSIQQLAQLGTWVHTLATSIGNSSIGLVSQLYQWQ